MIYLGYDPGGDGKGGVAILNAVGAKPAYETDLTDSVDEAIRWLTGRANGAPAAAGIDAMLFWETGPSGWRAADKSLKARYSAVEKSIVSSNSAFGAMAVQGMALAMLLRKQWPNIILTETHPKVLYYACTNKKYQWSETSEEMQSWLLTEMGCKLGAPIDSDDKWDALISAWAAKMGHTRAWTTDLRCLSDKPLEPAGTVAYCWPNTLRP
jgi:hypothetical protein